MHKMIIVANWKMNPALVEDAVVLFRDLKNSAVKYKNITTVVCPPAVFVSEIKRRMGKIPRGREVFLGVQNIFGEQTGSNTGEISPVMAKSCGAEYTIVGHSERRNSACCAGETDDCINAKIFYALKAEMNVILCVGERERDVNGEYFDMIRKQLEADIPKIHPKYYRRILVAYEPIWAIGKDAARPATTEEILQVSIHIRKTLVDIIGKRAAMETPILYGGSVNTENAGAVLKSGGVQGLLVGRDSLSAESFASILEIANKA